MDGTEGRTAADPGRMYCAAAATADDVARCLLHQGRTLNSTGVERGHPAGVEDHRNAEGGYCRGRMRASSGRIPRSVHELAYPVRTSRGTALHSAMVMRSVGGTAERQWRLPAASTRPGRYAVRQTSGSVAAEQIPRGTAQFTTGLLRV